MPRLAIVGPATSSVELGEHFETKIINGQWISHRDCSAWSVVELKPAVNDDLDAVITG